MKTLIVRLSNSKNYSDTFDLEFDLIASDFLSKWIDRFLEAQQRQYPISEPWALYNCNDKWTPEQTLNYLNHHIDICNSIQPGMFKRKLVAIDDQDTLNYIHSEFELNHGQLDKWKCNEVFKESNGDKLRFSLSQINQTVHRCESQGHNPRIRVVYFDLPKTKTFDESDYKLFTNSVEFGGVYSLYADVGKNLESLAQDNDQHHHDFVPNLHYSADFQIKFYNKSPEKDQALYQEYLKKNIEYFIAMGYSETDPRLTTGCIKLAQLRCDNKLAIINKLKNYDNIQSVFLF